MNSYTKNQTIISAGEAFTGFYIIMDGSVQAIYHFSETAKIFPLKKGDVVGIFDFGLKEHTFTYRTAEDTNLIFYALPKFADLSALLNANKDLGHFLSLSLVQNVSRIIHYYHTLNSQQEKLYHYLVTAVSNYQKFGTLLSLPVKSIPGKERIQPFVSDREEPAFWLEHYYQELKTALLSQNTIFASSPIVTGLLAAGSTEIHNIMYCCEAIQEYLQDIGAVLLNDNSLDLFDLYTDLLFRGKTAQKDTAALEERIEKMTAILSSQIFANKELAAGRIREYQENLKRDHSYSMDTEETLPQIQQKLAHSLELILDYADPMDVVRGEFMKYIELYKKTPDKNSSDKNVDTIRRQLTRLFNIIYTETFQVALQDPTPPTVIKMFLHFGYMDAELAGMTNAAYLYSIAKNYQGDPEHGVYTLYEWIHAIYSGKKQPSRNELSQDYASYVNTLRAQGKIDPKAVQKMLDDTTGKVMYELESMFPVVNKITNGHVTTFCPIFVEENVMKELDSILTTPYKIKEALDHVLAVDFSAFYRDYLYADEKTGLRENVTQDVHPDFVIMPNVGSNGVCWQEIEGMSRSTPGRMMVSAFHLENLDRTMMQMIGDFRWELCRRIQGMRWNDVTEHSLTSEYYDYAMFYAKNRALSQDAKEKIKLALARARNNYKNLFIMDYCNWIQYESKGSVKLNKVARQIFSLYCPFTSEICESVISNGAFTETIQLYVMKKKQKIHRLQKMVQKYQAQGKAVPEVIEQQIRLLNK